MDHVLHIAKSYKPTADKVWLLRYQYDDAEEKAAMFAQSTKQNINENASSIEKSQEILKTKLKLSERIASARVAIRNEIKGAEKKIKQDVSVRSSLSSLQQHMSSLTRDVSELAGSLDVLEKRINNLECTNLTFSNDFLPVADKPINASQNMECSGCKVRLIKLFHHHACNCNIFLICMHNFNYLILSTKLLGGLSFL